jgi:hypothetical protein
MKRVFFTCFFQIGSKRFIIKITEQNTQQMRSETRVYLGSSAVTGRSSSKGTTQIRLHPVSYSHENLKVVSWLTEGTNSFNSLIRVGPIGQNFN